MFKPISVHEERGIPVTQSHTPNNNYAAIQSNSNHIRDLINRLDKRTAAVKHLHGRNKLYLFRSTSRSREQLLKKRKRMMEELEKRKFDRTHNLKVNIQKQIKEANWKKEGGAMNVELDTGLEYDDKKNARRKKSKLKIKKQFTGVSSKAIEQQEDGESI